MERESIRERAALGKLGAARAGKVPAGQMPLGYRRGADGRPVIDEPGAETVRRIFAESVAGRSTLDIANGLTVDGVPTPNGRGAGWFASTVSRILKATCYAGSWTYADTDVVVDFPQIVTPETFKAAQDALRTRISRSGRNTSPGRYLLQHLVSCSVCGRKFTSRSRAGSDTPKYYACQGVLNGLACRQPKYLNAGRLDALVWQEIAEFLTDPEAFAEALDTDDGDTTEADIETLERDLERISTENERAAHLYTSGRIDDQIFDKLTSRTTDRMAALTDRLAGLRKQRRESTDRAGLVDSITAWAARIADGIEDLDLEGRKEIARLVLDGVEVSAAGNVTVTFRLPVSVGERVI